VNVAAAITLNKTDPSEQAGLAPLALLREIDRGLRHVLDLLSINAWRAAGWRVPGCRDTRGHRWDKGRPVSHRCPCGGALVASLLPDLVFPYSRAMNSSHA
jgi:hypothetical protein